MHGQAKKVVLAAGTFGSTFLLLTNAKRLGLPRGPALGSRFSGNGDLLGFVMKAGRRLDASTGPVITSAMRLPDKVDPLQDPGNIGAYIEDAGYPGFADWLVEFSRLGAVVRRRSRVRRQAAVGGPAGPQGQRSVRRHRR